MKRMKRVIVISLCALLLIIGAFAVHVSASVTIDGYTYNLTSRDTAALIGWDNSSDTLSVPSYIGIYPVTDIADSAFSNDDFITSLDLSGADRLTRIGKYAFYHSALQGALDIPWSVAQVGVSAFDACDGLTEVAFNCGYTAVPAQCFMDCVTLTKATIGDTVTGIGRYAFGGCAQLTEIVIADSVVDINPTAFVGCEDLTIYCYTDSAAHRFAEEQGITYVLLDASEPTEPPTEEPTQAPTEEPTEEPTDAPTEEPTVPLGYYLGDTDGDEEITIRDATIIQRILAEFIDDTDGMMTLRGDVGRDGLDIDDVTKIQRYIISLKVSDPIGEWITL